MAAIGHRGPSATPASLATFTNGTPSQTHDDPSVSNGHNVPVQEPRPAPTPTAAMASNAANKKAKGKKALDSTEASKLVAARISQLEVDTAAEREQEVEIDREVRKHTRELNHQMNKMNDTAKVDLLAKRSSDLFASLKRLERDNIKNKKRADQLQKEKDASRTDLSKQIGLKEKLEKLCRELQKENNKLKVLETLEGYQEEKDNPRKQVVYMKAEELFKQRFKSLIEQYELRELHFHSAMRTKEIEVQWNMARFEQQKKAAEAESNRARQLNSQVVALTKTETELRNQLNAYAEKYKQKLTSIINQMQQQGRGIPAGMQSAVQSSYAEGAEADEGDLEGEGDSECDYDEDEEDEEEEEQMSEGEFDDDTEEDVPNVPGAYGPERPPAMNGHR
ncbi:myosin-like coiled-coil protein-domain-containing protein [Poronia punctata]|nr:myosin-like coiled-coil protein-domain-containing protein [Poronia punctata]